MKKVKLLVGMLLIVSAVAGLVFWESKGREAVLCSPVLVANRFIEKGSPLTSSLFTTVGVPEKNRIQGALSPKEAGKVIGKVASQSIVKNAQMSVEYAQEPDRFLKQGQSVFVIPKKWIAMRSSGLRRGDQVRIYSRDGAEEVGRYRIAFVKDEAEREVQDAEEGRKTDLLNRLNSTSVINHLEIVTDMEGYQKLWQMAEREAAQTPPEEEPRPCLMVVYDPEDGAGKPEAGESKPESDRSRAQGVQDSSWSVSETKINSVEQKGAEQHE